MARAMATDFARSLNAQQMLGSFMEIIVAVRLWRISEALVLMSIGMLPEFALEDLLAAKSFNMETGHEEAEENLPKVQDGSSVLCRPSSEEELIDGSDDIISLGSKTTITSSEVAECKDDAESDDDDEDDDDEDGEDDDQEEECGDEEGLSADEGAEDGPQENADEEEEDEEANGNDEEEDDDDDDDEDDDDDDEEDDEDDEEDEEDEEPPAKKKK